MKIRTRVKNIVVTLLLAILALVFMFPLYLTIINAFKPLKEILKNLFAFPSGFYLENFRYVLDKMDFFTVFLNTFTVTLCTLFLVLFLAPMCAYKLSRVDDRKSKIILICLISSMIVPFQTVMIPIVNIASKFGFYDSIPGLIIIEFALNVPFTVFMYYNLIKKIPKEMDEAAKIDGCSDFGIFFRVVRPMLGPVNATVGVIITLWVWNDYALPNILMTSTSKKPLTLAIYKFFSAHQMRWDYALAGLFLTALPIAVFYVIMQKKIINGMVDGAMKG